MRIIGGPETKRYILIDGSNLLYRAYFAFVEARLEQGLPLLAAPDGYPTGVVYGSLQMLSNWLPEIENPSQIIVFFDGSPKRRLRLDPLYKVKRQSDSSRGMKLSQPATGVSAKKLSSGHVAHSEVDILAHVLRLMGCDIYHHPEEEADDLIASFCELHPESIRIIISSDKDFFQLLTDPRVVQYVPGQDGNRFFDAERATKYWTKFNKGKHPVVPVEQVRMFKTLCGDSSDSIIGVERLRKNSAIKVCHLTSIDQVMASGFPGFSESEKSKAILARDRLHINYELVGLHRNIPLELCLLPAQQDFGMAQDVLTQDLGINNLDISSFRLGKTPKIMEVIPIDNWLMDVIG